MFQGPRGTGRRRGGRFWSGGSGSCPPGSSDCSCGMPGGGCAAGGGGGGPVGGSGGPAGGCGGSPAGGGGLKGGGGWHRGGHRCGWWHGCGGRMSSCFDDLQTHQGLPSETQDGFILGTGQRFAMSPLPKEGEAIRAHHGSSSQI